MGKMKTIILSQREVAAIIDGRKTVKRIVIKQQPSLLPGEVGRPVRNDDGSWSVELTSRYGLYYKHELKPKYEAGDIVGVREAWVEGKIVTVRDEEGEEIRSIVAEGDDLFAIPREWASREDLPTDGLKCRLGTQMWVEDIRLYLRIKGIALARLNDMTEEDAIKEGYDDLGVDADSPLERYSCDHDANLRSHERPELTWYNNPWVWVLDFERIPYHEAHAAHEAKNMKYLEMCTLLNDYKRLCEACDKNGKCAGAADYQKGISEPSCELRYVVRHIDAKSALDACFKILLLEKKKELEPWVIKMRKKRQYEIVDAITNELFTSGSADQCAEAMGISLKAFYKAAARSAQGGYRKFKVQEVVSVEKKQPVSCASLMCTDEEVADKLSDKSIAKAVREWNNFMDPIRKYYGIPKYVPKGGEKG